MAAAAPTDLVLDTNVVLDWLVFRNAAGTAVGEALASGRFRWLASRPMRDELARVVVREALARWAIDPHTVLAAFDAHAVDAGLPRPLGAHECLRCSDADDQPFIDLAVAHRAHALLTRDRAVLRLARRAQRLGVVIATPEAWLRR